MTHLTPTNVRARNLSGERASAQHRGHLMSSMMLTMMLVVRQSHLPCRNHPEGVGP
ncbi:hypothetical protein JYU34_016947 [Plutella xylostella]|uniref:Uncharacterized protein n=1 Tax=Plutella xylostella TaxID=51655 RepID=A0ABQ7Q3W2_PLUXY|nr:hypothetical protein JYU34_016947 [Plutella xylostella]